MSEFLLYGANGYTGELVAEEAVKRGHRPTLAGRSREKIAPVAARFDLPFEVVDLGDARALTRVVGKFPLVFHAAGPFIRTSEAMVSACLQARAHYVDVTGEIPVFERTLARDGEAKERGVCLISGVGFDVIPSDCLAKYVADAVPGANKLDIAIVALGRASAGTAKSALTMMPKGNLVRRNGKLESAPMGTMVETVRFPIGEREVVAIPWGDLVTAYATTGIPDITTYMSFPPRQVRAMRRFGRAMGALLSSSFARGIAEKIVERTVRGPTADERARGKSYLWARASGPKGAKEAWLVTSEGYAFTATGGVRAVEEIFEKKPVGALTPALAFGADFVLRVPPSERFDELPR